MNIIHGERQTGKTTDLITMCAGHWYSLIVTFSRQRASDIFRQAQKMEQDIPLPITFQDFLQGEFHAPNIKKFYFDDLDICLNQMAKGVPIDTIVFNKRG